MKQRFSLQIFLSVLLIISCNSVFSQKKSPDNWTHWRGQMHTGAAIKGNPPVEFSETKNLKWKTDIPGKGHATPVVWGDKIIVQTAVATGEISPEAPENAGEGSRMAPNQTNLIHEFKVLMVDRNTGNILWETLVTREWPRENTHELGSWASNSPCTDGERIYAWFGSRGIYCLDFDGNIIWQRNFGQMQKHMSFGEGSSPFVYKDKIFIQWDHEGDSFLFALDKTTGEIDWQVERDEGTSWSSPFVTEINGHIQVITSATNQVRAYDYYTGEVIWTTTGLTRNVIPNPIYADGILYVMSGFRGSALQAIDLKKAKGDITGTDAVLWTYDKNTPYTPQPVLMNGKLYFMRVNNGFLSCIDAKTGEPFYENERLGDISTLYSSPTGVNDRLYIAAENVVMVIKAGVTFEILASNPVDDNFHASPVIAGNDLILRGFNSLYCFSKE
ncbi:MAG: PQQ-binding-like beta-propeller repeat protein [Mariniphaga sp.]|nr:PQQ-binding-like beta-propeller repeat protein [Mariniphaga sp.]